MNILHRASTPRLSIKLRFFNGDNLYISFLFCFMTRISYNLFVVWTNFFHAISIKKKTIYVCEGVCNRFCCILLEILKPIFFLKKVIKPLVKFGYSTCIISWLFSFSIQAHDFFFFSTPQPLGYWCNFFLCGAENVGSNDLPCSTVTTFYKFVVPLRFSFLSSLLLCKYVILFSFFSSQDIFSSFPNLSQTDCELHVCVLNYKFFPNIF